MLMGAWTVVAARGYAAVIIRAPPALHLPSCAMTATLGTQVDRFRVFYVLKEVLQQFQADVSVCAAAADALLVHLRVGASS